MPGQDDRSVHEPVQVEAVLEWLRIGEGSTILELTVGAAGHTEKILSATSSGRVIGLDQDRQILEIAKLRLERFGDRVTLRHASFDRLADVCAELGVAAVDGALFDLGVSSLQLDEPERGFSFDEDGPLDMRMNPDSGRTAADLVNRGTRDELFFAIRTLGDEPQAKRIVDAILAARRLGPLRRTCELVDLIEGQVRQPRHHHKATKTFLGLRMAVNDELGALQRALPAAISLLRPGARAVVIAFHGGEDRVVKQCFRRAERSGDVRVLTPKPSLPEPEEIQRNPRARSSRIRVVERLRSNERSR